MPPQAGLDDAIGGLYAVDPEEFVPRRDELARELRTRGERAGADRVKALRKPTVAAWAVNQLARREARGLERLFAAGESLRTEHGKLLAGGSAAGIAKARERERDAIRALADAARAILEERGRGADAALERVTDTLHAAAVDEEVAALVREGRLDKEREAAGFGFDAVPEAAAAPIRKGTAPGDDRRARREEAARAKEAAAKERLAEARRAVKEAERACKERARELEQAERELERRRAAEQAAERDVERAARARTSAR
ncbi:MAG TPA: hypothetical protein VHF23_03235 [Gaiellaceae bacterium]|nr:hypothetical protein [Gaiellaceae bacterium]